MSGGGKGREFSHGRYPGTKLRAGWELDCKWVGRVGVHNRLTVSGVLHVRQSRVQLGRRGYSVLYTSLCGHQLLHCGPKPVKFLI